MRMVRWMVGSLLLRRCFEFRPQTLEHRLRMLMRLVRVVRLMLELQPELEDRVLLAAEDGLVLMDLDLALERVIELVLHWVFMVRVRDHGAAREFELDGGVPMMIRCTWQKRPVRGVDVAECVVNPRRG